MSWNAILRLFWTQNHSTFSKKFSKTSLVIFIQSSLRNERNFKADLSILKYWVYGVQVEESKEGSIKFMAK